MGNAHVERNQPFLSTLELFKLKGDRARAYLALDAKSRRAFLAGDLAKVSRDSVTFSGADGPTDIDTLEWFASVADLAKALAWIRRHTEGTTTRLGRDLMGINPGLDLSGENLSYVGYKGGSEPGVLNLSYLLRSRGGTWYALSVTWNDPKAPVDEAKLFTLVQGMVPLLTNEK